MKIQIEKRSLIIMLAFMSFSQYRCQWIQKSRIIILFVSANLASMAISMYLFALLNTCTRNGVVVLIIMHWRGITTFNHSFLFAKYFPKFSRKFLEYFFELFFLYQLVLSVFDQSLVPPPVHISEFGTTRFCLLFLSLC